MAQMGSFVPAASASIGVIDKVFTRVGASDNLSRGESTFMVEMTETASILNNLSDRSLILMDEIGRGTRRTMGYPSPGPSLSIYTITRSSNQKRYLPRTTTN